MNNLDIKKLRISLKLKQQDFADLVGVSKSSVQKWEKGERSPDEIQVQKLTEISEGLTKAHNISFQESAVILDPTIMKVPLVNQYAYAGYIDNFGDPEYVDKLPEIPFESDKEHKGEYLCFEVKGDSMDNNSAESYLEGDILLCRNVRKDYWKSKLHINKWDFVIVHKERGIIVKRITKHDVEKGIITVHSLNDYYEDYDLFLGDILQIFNIVDFKRKPRRR